MGQPRPAASARALPASNVLACASASKASGSIARRTSRLTLDRVLAHRAVLGFACALLLPSVSALSCGGTVSRVSPGDAGSIEEASRGSTVDGGAEGGQDAGCGVGLQCGAPWPMFAQSPSLRARSAAVGPATPTVKWFFPAAVTAQPAVAADGTIYFGTDDGTLYALDGDGSVKWTFSAGAGVSFGGTPAIRADGTVLVGAQTEPGAIGELYAVSFTGALVWTYDTTRGDNLAPPSPSIGDDGTIYISAGYHLYAVHPDGSLAWQADAGDEYVIVPAIGPDGTVYVGGQYGLQAFTPAGTQSWAFGPCADVVAECTSQETVADDGTIVTTMATLSQAPDAPGYLLVAVRPDGTQAWSLDLSVMGVGAAVGADGTIFVPTGYDLASISPGGQQNWASALPGAGGGAAPVIDAAGTLYLGTSAWTEAAPCGDPCEELSGAGLQAFRADGTVAWVFEPDTAFASPAIGADGTLYAAAVGGGDAGARQGLGLYAIGP
jgi:outer membrane protein assembly factor BamB